VGERVLVLRPYTAKGICGWCGRSPLPARRRAWCSDACRDKFMVRHSPGWARYKLWERDRGVCVRCGLDTQELEAAIRELRFPGEQTIWHRLRGAEPTFGSWEAVSALIRAIDSPWPESLWECHHRHALAEGGEPCGLDGLETLCWRCHAAETAALAARLAKARRAGR
jgi:5-methylcytosine-specific restriction endonuclease McrA